MTVGLSAKDKKQLKIFCRQFRNGMLDGKPSKGQCAKVSWALQGYLSFALKLDTEVHQSDVGKWNHMYLVLPDGDIIDCTADQFGKKYPQVYIGKPLAIHNGKVYGL